MTPEKRQIANTQANILIKELERSWSDRFGFIDSLDMLESFGNYIRSYAEDWKRDIRDQGIHNGYTSMEIDNE